MRHTAGKLANGIKLLRLPQLRFELAPLRQVGQHRERSAIMAEVIEQGDPETQASSSLPSLRRSRRSNWQN